MKPVKEEEFAPARNAWQKALRLEDECEPVWDPDEKQWSIESATSPGELYQVWEREGVARLQPWWVRLGCTCAAAAAGRPACWHRARVALYWRRVDLNGAG